MMYVLEGSTLGGRMILRELSLRGVSDARLAFLDPYGSETGSFWRAFLHVLGRETGEDDIAVQAACRGGVDAFAHAERVLCGEAA